MSRESPDSLEYALLLRCKAILDRGDADVVELVLSLLIGNIPCSDLSVIINAAYLLHRLLSYLTPLFLKGSVSTTVAAAWRSKTLINQLSACEILW
jgi:hypothetical protein